MVKPSNAPISPPPPYRTNPHLYEIHTWAWLEELSAREDRLVTLASVPDQEWDRLQSLGFDFVWLMGIWKRSAAGRTIARTSPCYFPSYDEALPGWTMKDVVGSPYSIQDYIPDPRIGGWKDVDAAREKLHRRGMKLILDFVPNHTGLDHPWVSSHPEYYIQGSLDQFRRDPSAFFLAERDSSATFIARGRDPHFPAWPDTAQLNYFNPATRDAMLCVLRAIAGHADGARCDMAMLLLHAVFVKTWGPLLRGFAAPGDEFWPAAVAALPGFVWIAEVYWDLEWRLQQLGLTFTYDKRLYDRLRAAPPQDVRDCLKADAASQSRCVRFLENHDEPRSAAVFESDKLGAAATLVATLPGMRFYYHGQLEGRKLHLPIQLSRAAEEPPNSEIYHLYEKLLRITCDNAFHAGAWLLLEPRAAGDTSFQKLIAYQWRCGGVMKIVAVNLSSASARGNFILSGAIDPSREYGFHDQLHDKSYEWQGQDLIQSGLFVRLDAFQGHIFEVAME
ncbi:MAG: alpha-amylase family glycosyl hydrolase [Terriglobia bacterium]